MPLRLLVLMAFAAFGFVLLAAAAFFFPILAPVLVPLALAALVALILLGAFLFFAVHRLDLRLLGLGGLTSLPAIPFNLSPLLPEVATLVGRSSQTKQAVDGLSAEFTIGPFTENAYTFMGMGYSQRAARSQDPRTRLSLTAPEQFAMSWTTFGGVEADAVVNWLPRFAPTLTDPAVATAEFWPTISRFGLAYNLIVLQRVPSTDASFRTLLGAGWTPQMETVWQADELFVIDMRICASFGSGVEAFATRFTPGTLTFLRRDPAGDIAPFAIVVSDAAGATMTYADTDPAWIYALQAAKTSITVFGIWFGHVYQWHIVTAAMQMSMFRRLPALHPVRQLLRRQSDYLIPFDQFLLLDWEIAPPTSVTSSRAFLTVLDGFAAGRPFFADDPPATIARLGLQAQDFTTPGGAPFDRYPVARHLLDIFDATATYVGGVVSAYYPDDASVAGDSLLQRWIAASSDPAGGNVSGLPAVTTRASLTAVLASLIYRITAHGASRLVQAANPAIAFAANFPPCLQSATLPAPSTPFEFVIGPTSPPGTMSLASFLPNTGTIGEYANFLFTFVYSPPSIPFIPFEGIGAETPFVGPFGVAAAANAALVGHRRAIRDVMRNWAADTGADPPPAQVHQWELNIET